MTQYFSEDQYGQKTGIGTPDYNRKAEHVINMWLNALKETHQNTDRINSQNNPFDAQLEKTPPALNVMHYPAGGVTAGTNRLREKFSNGESLSWGFFLPEIITTVAKEDITRETIVMTAGNIKIQSIAKQNLLLPTQLKLVKELQAHTPNTFIAIKRSLFGIEKEQDSKTPFSIVAMNDATWDYLEKLVLNI